MIDTDPSHVQLQPENAIVLPKWKGEASDKGLVAMIPFLEYLAMMAATGQPVDVRKVLESMKGKMATPCQANFLPFRSMGKSGG